MVRYKELVLLLFSPASRLANKVNWRFGRPYRCSNHFRKVIDGRLRPGMVLLSHKDYELTNLFIKGYWTHVAVVASDGHIIEALSKGVTRTLIEDFFTRTDDFMLLDPQFCGETGRTRAVQFAESFVGYPYNFRFVQRNDSFTCIDLVSRAYALRVPRDSSKPDSFSFIDYLTEEVIMPEHLLHPSLKWEVLFPGIRSLVNPDCTEAGSVSESIMIHTES
jgi:hypothetical protein